MASTDKKQGHLLIYILSQQHGPGPFNTSQSTRFITSRENIAPQNFPSQRVASDNFHVKQPSAMVKPKNGKNISLWLCSRLHIAVKLAEITDRRSYATNRHGARNLLKTSSQIFIKIPSNLCQTKIIVLVPWYIEGVDMTNEAHK
jgi:hypothetical protein